MLQELQSLFGLSCIDEAMPAAGEEDRITALLDAAPLRAAIEKAPVVTLGQTQTFEDKPAPEPTMAPSFAPGRK